jgi:hypothetical protein
MGQEQYKKKKKKAKPPRPPATIYQCDIGTNRFWVGPDKVIQAIGKPELPPPGSSKRDAWQHDLKNAWPEIWPDVNNPLPPMSTTTKELIADKAHILGLATIIADGSGIGHYIVEKISVDRVMHVRLMLRNGSQTFMMRQNELRIYGFYNPITFEQVQEKVIQIDREIETFLETYHLEQQAQKIAKRTKPD